MDLRNLKKMRSKNLMNIENLIYIQNQKKNKIQTTPEYVLADKKQERIKTTRTGEKMETCRLVGIEEWKSHVKRSLSAYGKKVLEDLEYADCPYLRSGGTFKQWIHDVEQFVTTFKGNKVGPMIYMKFAEAVKLSNFGPITKKIVQSHVKRENDFVKSDEESVADTLYWIMKNRKKFGKC